MLKLTQRYARALLAYAREEGLEEIYRLSLKQVLRGDPGRQAVPEQLARFLDQVPGDSEAVQDILYAFLDLARKEMNLLEAEIISAVPLRPEQLALLEQRLIRMFRKQLEITTTVDPSILGGVRILINNMILDDTVKRKLQDMKSKIYKGVYLGR